MPQKRGRKEKEGANVYGVGISLDGRLLNTLDREARRLGISRSELARRGVARELARIKRLGRPEYQERERRAAERPTTEQVNNGPNDLTAKGETYN